MPELSGAEFVQLVERIGRLRTLIRSRSREIVIKQGSFGRGVISGDSVVRQANAELNECLQALDECIFTTAEKIVSEKKSGGREHAAVSFDEIYLALCGVGNNQLIPGWCYRKNNPRDYRRVLSYRARRVLMAKGYVRDPHSGKNSTRYVREAVAA